jgi:hypothetical protein
MSNTRIWVDTAAMADRLGIHPKTLLRLRKQQHAPFAEGTHYRYGGLTTGAPLQWFPELTDQAFTDFRRVPVSAVETFSALEAVA